MRSKKNKTANRSSIRVAAAHRLTNARHIAFIPLLALTLIVWVIYRVQFKFPVWFDETIGKAIFFGLPVWLYISLTRSKTIPNTFAPERLEPGLLLGVLVGGIFGFAGTIAGLLRQHVIVQAVPLFSSNLFWQEFFLALMTGFWESLFFYTWIMVVIQEKFYRWSLVNQVLLTAGIFLLFHLPNIFLRFSPQTAMVEIFLLFLFAIGQAFLFAKSRNAYALMISQAIWGMVLLIHTR